MIPIQPTILAPGIFLLRVPPLSQKLDIPLITRTPFLRERQHLPFIAFAWKRVAFRSEIGAPDARSYRGTENSRAIVGQPLFSHIGIVRT